jgi:hypothetical protein
MRLVFACLLLVHGLIHLMGFVKEFRLAEVAGLSGKMLIPLPAEWAKPAGALWLLTSGLLLLTALIFLLRKEWWWVPGVVALLFSQALIILYWPDAKFGTLANVLILLVALVAYGSWRFNAMVRDELDGFYPQTYPEKTEVSAEMIAAVPPVVQKWLYRSNLTGRESIHTVYLKQRGEMRTRPDGKWMPVVAEQRISVDPPGFIWTADVRMAPMVYLKGRDKYAAGRGHMLIQLLSLLPVADARGPATDQGTLLRCLGEIVWLPSAALSKYITWEEIDSTRARATMRYGDIQASGVFTFSPEGDVRSFEAQRYYDRKGGATLERWFIRIDDQSYREFNGIRIPVKCSVTWKLAGGDFTWYQLEISEVAYNQSAGAPVPDSNRVLSTVAQ